MSEYDFKWDDLSDEQKSLAKIQMSEQLARARYKDYAATIEPANERMKNDDDFRRELMEAEDPAELMYQTGKAMTPMDLDEILGNKD